METPSAVPLSSENERQLAAWRQRYQQYQQRMEDFKQKRARLQHQQWIWSERHRAYQMMLEDLQRVKFEREQRQRLTRRPF